MTNTLSSLLIWARKVLEASPYGNASEARPILAWAAGMSVSQTLLQEETSLSEQQTETFRQAVQARGEGKPLARILGEKEFYSLPFGLNEATLVPRPDSECLIDELLSRFQDSSPKFLCDIGTGSGCLGLTLLHHWTEAHGLLIDISLEALSQARENTKALRLSDRTRFAQGDLGEGLPPATFDVMISNPPYISQTEYEGLDLEVKDYDPKQALIAEHQGLACYERLLPQMAKALKPGGVGIVEIGWKQALAVSDFAKAAGFSEITVGQDGGGRDRFVSFCL